MNNLEKTTIKTAAKIAPWLAPMPSAYLVARASMAHLGLPIAAAIIETLGLSTVHSALWLADWNASKRKTDPQAPVVVALALGAVYLVATLGLVVFLEVWPGLATYAPALFLALAIVGGVDLALISQQERRESADQAEMDERKALRQAKRQADRQPNSPKASNLTPKAARFDDPTVKARQAQSSNRHARLDALLTYFLDNPSAGPTEAGRAIGVSRQTIYNYLEQLQVAGRVARNDSSVEVLGAGRS